jgi:glycosyltransferase involved in cell wall biosynthesis
VHEFSAFAPLWPRRSLRRKGVLFFYHFVGHHALRKHPLVGSLAWAAEAMTLRAYQRVVTISPSVEDQVRDRRGASAAVDCLYTGVDDGYFGLESEEDGDDPFILYFGRLDVHTKGIDLLLSAFAQVSGEFPRVRLVLAGRSSADQRQRAQRLIEAAGLQNQVVLHGDGAVSEAEKGELLRRCLFLCMPSRYEGWGIVAVEAAATGKAVLATRIPGLVDAVQEGQTGYLVPPGDQAGLAEGMRQLLVNPELRVRLGTAGRVWAKRFDWDSIARSQEELLQRAAQANVTD